MHEKQVNKYKPLAAARKSAAMTQKDMSEAARIPMNRIVNTEKEPQTASLEFVRRYYENVGVDGRMILKKFVNDFIFCDPIVS